MPANQDNNDSTSSKGDELETAFRNEWRAGRTPRLEEYLARELPARRPEVLRKLLAAEIEERQQLGHVLSQDEYVGRFPDEHALDESIFLASIVARAPAPSNTEAKPADRGEHLRHQEHAEVGAWLSSVFGARYRFERQLGKGAFGVVYLVRDMLLERQVAVKVANKNRFRDAADRDRFLDEARKVAQLRHPGIATIYDVRNEGDDIAIFQEYVPGRDLREWLSSRQKCLPPDMAATLIAQVADIVSYAHQQGFVHRDLKPENILLIEADMKPCVIDFGVALDDRTRISAMGEIAGTLAYMSPEQMCGESPRIDGRSDIWSLGVLLYELLVGQRPFDAPTPRALVELIRTAEPMPLRQKDPSLPEELDSACRKCLAKSPESRYTTAADLASDLRHWRARGAASTVQHPGPSPSQFPAMAPRIVPKGLRSFEAIDADFILELLPGVKASDGLPESIREWKSRLDSNESVVTFRACVIYGPSGSGKSSWLKAGLLPRLEQVTAVRIDATTTDTERHLLLALKRRFPHLRRANCLGDAIEALVSSSHQDKVLLVIDQFEQWLHGRTETDQRTLADAVGKCDGHRVQALLVVRSDFWTPLKRFLSLVEIPLSDLHNAVHIDLFDKRHAVNVLTLFGRAYGALPAEGPLDEEQRRFVSEAVEALSVDGRVICVQLSMFADMLKAREWSPRTLRDMRGSQGVGFAFLEDTFYGPNASRTVQQHAPAAQKVLGRLLPSKSVEISNSFCSESELRRESGYERHPEAFDELMKLLDAELRLITPTAPYGDLQSPLGEDETKTGEKQYRLTHDYLVPSLRDWLTAKQRETWRGRAFLLLAERTAEWTAKPHIRSLPGPLEYLRIIAAVILPTWRRTRPRQRPSITQQSVLWAASRWYAKFTAATLAVALGITLGAWWEIRSGKDRDAVDGAVQNLPGATAANVSDLLENLRRRPDYAVTQLRAAYDAQVEPSKKLRLAYGLIAVAAVKESTDDVARFVLDHLGDVPPDDNRLFVAALSRLADVESVRQELYTRSDPKGVVDEKEITTRMRYAIAALSLGRIEAAERLRVVEGDPTARTAFIRDFAHWPTRLRELVASLSRVQDAEVRSGLCLALGGVDRRRWTDEGFGGLRAQFFRLYQEDPDAGVHSAAGWALKEWQVALPDLARLPAPPSEPPAGDRSWFVNSLGLTMVQVPKGAKRKYRIGSKVTVFNNPVREVEVARFWLSACEVTVEQFQALRAKRDSNQTGADFLGASELARPVTNVTWYDAVFFCNWLSAQEKLPPPYYYEISGIERDQDGSITSAEVKTGVGQGYRLPTEVEWEVACRAGTTTEFSFGNQERELGDYGWFQSNSRGGTQQVASKRSNPWGLHDMHGNVWEWCEDGYDKYESSQQFGPTGPQQGASRVYRGGSWGHSDVLCPSSHRIRGEPSARDVFLGFRVARSPSGVSSGSSTVR